MGRAREARATAVRADGIALMGVAMLVGCRDGATAPRRVPTDADKVAQGAIVPIPSDCTKSWLLAVDGDWADASNGTPSGVPTVIDVACIIARGRFTVTVSGFAAVNGLFLGSSASTPILVFVDVLLTASSTDAKFDKLVPAAPVARVADKDGNADLVLTILNLPDSVRVWQYFTFTVQITNNGPTTITCGSMTLAPLTWIEIAAVTGRNSYGWSSLSLICFLDPLANGATQTITATSTGLAIATYSSPATLSTEQPDPVLTNNGAALALGVR